MAKLTGAERNRGTRLGKAIYDLRARAAGNKAQREAIWEAALAEIEQEELTVGIVSENVKHHIAERCQAKLPKANVNWLELIEKLLPIILGVLKTIFG